MGVKDSFGTWESFGQWTPDYYRWTGSPSSIFSDFSALRVRFSSENFQAIRGRGRLRVVYSGETELHGRSTLIYPKEETLVIPVQHPVTFGSASLEVMKLLRGSTDWQWSLVVEGLLSEKPLVGNEIELGFFN